LEILIIALIASAIYITYLLNKTEKQRVQLIACHCMIQAMAKDLTELGHPTIVLGKVNDKTSH
jgi:peroxiredoxin family protein